MRHPVTRSCLPFLLRKLHSLAGVVPIGVFLAAHLWTNAAALSGRVAYDRAVADIQALPGLRWLELFGIALPLVYHAAFGVFIVLGARPNVVRYPYSRNWMYAAQRVTGLLALLFVGLHVWEYRGATLLGRLGAESLHTALTANLSATQLGFPWTATAYVLGVGACVLHFSNGLWGFCFSWGLLASARARRLAAAGVAVVGLVLFSAGATTTFYFATGKSPFDSVFVPGAQRPCDMLDMTSRPPPAR